MNHFLLRCIAVLTFRWMFIIEGAVTIVFGAAAVFVLPDYPST